MARIMVTAMPFTGHVTPMLAVASELRALGHEVRFFSGGAFRPAADAAGVRFVPWREAPDFDEQDLPTTFPRLVGKKGFAQLMVNMADLFVGTAPGQVRDLAAEWGREPWELLVSEETSPGPAFAAETLGCRRATVAIAPLNLQSSQGPPPGLGLTPGRGPLGRARDAGLRALVPALAGVLQGPLSRARAELGLPRSRTRYDRLVFSPQLVLASGVASLDYGRTDRPAQLRWVGRLAPQPRADAVTPAWWDALDGRTVVHVTQGTQNVDPHDLLRPALEALADLDVLVVATTGVRGVAELPFPVPANARVADFVPYSLLLPRTHLMVTNGGWGGVLGALEHGVPLVIAGGDLDKPEVAARVAASGAGVNLRTGTPSAVVVRDAVLRILGDGGYAAAAARVRVELRTAGGAPRAAALLTAVLP